MNIMRYLGSDYSSVYLKCGKCKGIGLYPKDSFFNSSRPNKCCLCNTPSGIVWGVPPRISSVKNGIPYIFMTLLTIGAYKAITLPYFQNIYYFNKVLTSLNSQLIAILIPLLCSIIPLIFESMLYHNQEKRNRALIGVLLAIVAEGVLLGAATATIIGTQYMTLQITEPSTGEQLEYFGNIIGDVATGRGRLFDTEGNLIYQGGFKNNLFDGYGEKYEHITSVFDEKISDAYCVVYKGFYKNGIPHGEGAEYRYDTYYDFWKNGENPYLHYKGEFYEGVYCGIGTLYSSKEKYVGTFYDGEYNGYGSLLTVSSTSDKVYKYVGMYVDGQLNGEGKRYSPDGTLIFSGEYEQGNAYRGISYYSNGNIRYEGDWKNNMCHGFGKYYWPNGNIYYDGEWENDKFSGRGKLYYESGVLRYEGNFSEDQYNGYGINYYENGNIHYDGEYSNGKWYGYGAAYRENGTLSYEGQLENDEYCGKGKLYFEDGKTVRYDGAYIEGYRTDYGTEYYRTGQILYRGEWDLGYKQGYGVAYWMNGNIKYDGEWYKGLYSGQGREYSENGDLIYEGVFINGEFD